MSRKHRHHRRRLRLRKLLPLLVILPLMLLLIVGLFSVRQQEAQNRLRADQSTVSPNQQVTISWQGQTYALRKDLKTVALIGIDNAHGTGNSGQCDFISLLVLEPGSPSWKLLHLNRDTMCSINLLNAEGKKIGTETAQLALAHAYGSGGSDSCRNTLQAVENLLYGTPISQYLRIDLDSIGLLNDAVGGVTVEVNADLSPLDSAMTEGARLTLTGKQAEFFVRGRTGLADSSNQARMERQQIYMRSWFHAAKQTYSEMTADDAASLLEKIGKHLHGTMSSLQLAELADALAKTNAPTILTLPGQSKVGTEFVEFYPDEAALQQLVIDTFYSPVKE